MIVCISNRLAVFSLFLIIYLSRICSIQFPSTVQQVETTIGDSIPPEDRLHLDFSHLNRKTALDHNSLPASILVPTHKMVKRRAKQSEKNMEPLSRHDPHNTKKVAQDYDLRSRTSAGRATPKSSRSRRLVDDWSPHQENKSLQLSFTPAGSRCGLPCQCGR